MSWEAGACRLAGAQGVGWQSRDHEMVRVTWWYRSTEGDIYTGNSDCLEQNSRLSVLRAGLKRAMG